MKDIADYSFRFPEDFLFGTAQSAFQAEGACDRDGKSENMMEYYQRKFAGAYLPGARKELGGQIMSDEMPDDGCFFYDQYEEYIDDMKKTGQNAFRFSVSWSRLIPDGVGEINPIKTMKVAKPSVCKKCKRVTMTLNEVWLCPYCGTSNVCYSHIVDDVGKGINSLLKTFNKKKYKKEIIIKEI